MPQAMSRSFGAASDSTSRNAAIPSQTAPMLSRATPTPIKPSIRSSKAVRLLKCESTPRAAWATIQVISKTKAPAATGNSHRHPHTRVRAESHCCASAMVTE